MSVSGFKHLWIEVWRPSEGWPYVLQMTIFSDCCLFLTLLIYIVLIIYKYFH